MVLASVRLTPRSSSTVLSHRSSQLACEAAYSLTRHMLFPTDWTKGSPLVESFLLLGLHILSLVSTLTSTSVSDISVTLTIKVSIAHRRR